jgi:ABC-type multidrug transport system fused ATPase/permease subunit
VPTHPRARLWRALRAAYGWQFLLGGIAKLVQDLLLFAGPIVLSAIMEFMRSPEQPPSVGVGLAFAMFITAVVQSLSLHWYFFHMYRVAMRMRAALVMVIYKKSFTLSNAARQTATVGEIVNHQSDDVKKLYDLIPYLHLVWSSPLQIGIALYMLSGLLGWATVGGVAVLVVLIPVNTFIAKKSAALQKNTMKFKDARIKSMNELLSGIRLLKLFAWEQPFADKISGIREQELGSLRRYMLLGTVTSFFWSSTPLVVSVVSFSLYTLVSDTFTAQTAFTALALFNIIRFPMQALPSVISQAIEAYVSLGRIEGFLLKEDLDANAVTVSRSVANDDVAVEITNGSFRWAAAPPKKKDDDKAKKGANAAAEPPAPVASEASRRATLSNINIKVRRGTLTAIVGEVGSGKSSLLHALLGEIPKESGTVRVTGRMAYMAQQPWIQNASVKNNILFGDVEDEERYQRTLAVCQLTRDLESLPDGDRTEIGERGINLSGGQKARIQMARAVYNNVDIFLMDDPLSAVDAHVGNALFEGCMCKELKGKTRILVTHQLQYLAAADQVIVLRDGGVAECGTYAELMARRGLFASLIDKFVNTTDEVPESPAIDDPDVDAGRKALKASLGGAAASSSTATAMLVPVPAPTPSAGAAAAPAAPAAAAASATSRPSCPKVRVARLAAAKLIAEEERAVGGVSLSVYLRYIKSLGGLHTGLMLLVMYVVDQGSNVLTNWWLEFWSSDSGGASGRAQRELLSGPVRRAGAAERAAGVCARFLRSDYAALLGAQAAQGDARLRDSRAHVVLRHDAGRPHSESLLEGRDVDRHDAAGRAADVSAHHSQLHCDAGGDRRGDAALHCRRAAAVQGVHLRARLLSRVVARNPAHRLVVALADLRAVSGDAARREHDSLVWPGGDWPLRRHERGTRSTRTSRRWRSTLPPTAGSACASSSWARSWSRSRRSLRRSSATRISAGLAGLSITYALNLTGSLNWLVRMSSQTETELVAVERISEYAELETEAAPIIAESRPPAHWPTRGKIEFRDLKLRYRPGLPLVLQGPQRRDRAGRAHRRRRPHRRRARAQSDAGALPPRRGGRGLDSDRRH